MAKDIAYFEKALKKFRKVKENTYKFSGMEFSESMNLKSMDKNQVVLGHTVLHTCYSKYSDVIPKNVVIGLHDKFAQELNNRGVKHNKFDNLDRGDKNE